MNLVLEKGHYSKEKYSLTLVLITEIYDFNIVWQKDDSHCLTGKIEE